MYSESAYNKIIPPNSPHPFQFLSTRKFQTRGHLISRWTAMCKSLVQALAKKNAQEEFQITSIPKRKRFQYWHKRLCQFLQLETCINLFPASISKTKSCTHASPKTTLTKYKWLYFYNVYIKYMDKKVVYRQLHNEFYSVIATDTTGFS